MNLLSLGIKIGTDAYKSDTDTQQFAQAGLQLKRLFRSQEVELSVPYSKALARKLQTGRFDLDVALTALENNPTLAAQIMAEAGNYLREQDMLPAMVVDAGATEGVLPVPRDKGKDRPRNGAVKDLDEHFERRRTSSKGAYLVSRQSG